MRSTNNRHGSREKVCQPCGAAIPDHRATVDRCSLRTAAGPPRFGSEPADPASSIGRAGLDRVTLQWSLPANVYGAPIMRLRLPVTITPGQAVFHLRKHNTEHGVRDDHY